MKFKYHKDGTLPLNGEIFVFGSNLAGIHGAGAAKVAREKFGAKIGVGIGQYGNSYAIPTKDIEIITRSIDEILVDVLDFVIYTRKYPGLKFWLTGIGCGLAGYKYSEIAPMFKFCNPDKCNFPDAWMPYLEFSAGLANIEDIIYGNLESFEKHFCGDDELISTSFNSETMKINYILKEGQHVTNSFQMREFNAWLRSLIQ